MYTKAVLIALLIVATSAVYAGSLSNGFVHDDHFVVEENIWITDTGHLADIFSSNVWNFTTDSHGSNYYRPTLHLFLLAAHHIFGPEPWGFHLMSLALHCLNVILVFLIVSRLCPGGSLLPFFSAILFSIHPVNTEAVSWVSSLSDLAYALFYLLSFRLHLTALELKGAPRFLTLSLSALSLFFSLLSKETALTFILLISAYDYLNERLSPKKTILYAPYLAAVLAYLALRIYSLGGFVETNLSVSPVAALITAPMLLARYIGKLLLPTNLSVVYDIRLQHSAADPRF
ncbi:MAG: hypothetical protein HY880_04210, partial [Deltaproteobacteria bacterium]|nr:hypothetical protein [Deltaproteobacteria bacterium]